MTKPLDPPPSGKDFVWSQVKDWLYKIWLELAGLTFGTDPITYSAAVHGLSAPGDGAMGIGTGNLPLVGPTIMLGAINNSGFSAPASADTTITGWTSSVDTANAFNGTTYTIPIGGLYFTMVSILMNNVIYIAGGYAAVRIAKNGTQFFNGLNQMGTAGTATQYVNVHCQGVMLCKAGDTITTLVNQNFNGPGANTLYSGGLYNNLTIIKVG